MKYVYRSGFSVPGRTAEVVAAELSRIRKENGELTTEVVIEEARSEAAILHTAFEWDDAAAANEHRKQQARQLLRGVCIVKEDREPIPMHFHITTQEGGRYEPVELLSQDKDLYDAALDELVCKVRSAQHAVDQLLEVGSNREGEEIQTVQLVRTRLSEASEALAVLS